MWQNHSLAGLDLNVTVNYTRDSMLIGTTMTSFARDITTMLHSQHVQVSLQQIDLNTFWHAVYQLSTLTYCCLSARLLHMLFCINLSQ